MSPLPRTHPRWSQTCPAPSHPPPEAYCLHCGRPYPWTLAKFEALRAIAAAAEGLSEEDRTQLEEIIPDLISKVETPRSQVVIIRMKKLLKKGGGVFYDAIRETIVDVTSETIKKIFLP